MINLFLNFLNQNKIKYEKDSDGILYFKYNDFNYVFISNTHEGDYIRILLPRIADIQDDNELYFHRILNDLNQKFKVAKGTIWNIKDDETGIEKKSVWVTFEQIIVSFDNINILFKIGINMLEYYCNDFREEMLRDKSKA